MKQAHKQHYSYGFEGLFLKSDFAEMGIDACVYMKEEKDYRTGETILVQINRCLNKKGVHRKSAHDAEVHSSRQRDGRQGHTHSVKRIHDSRRTVPTIVLPNT